jgi:hypothetical protein
VTWDGEAIRRPSAKVPLPTEGAVEVAQGFRPEFFEDATVRGTHLRILTTPLVPSPRGAAVQVALPLRPGTRQAGAEEIGEEAMVAVPAALGVER